MRIEIANIIYDIEKSANLDQEFLSDLAGSIKEQGLLQPIIVSEAEKGFRLIAGLKRLLACKQLGWTGIDVDVRVVKSEDEANMIHIHEDLKRAHLDWWEKAELVAKYHELKLKELGQEKRGRGKPKTEDGKQWGLRDTARELGLALGPVSELISMNDYVQSHPSLRNIKDQRTAMKLIRREARRQEGEIESALIPPKIKLDEILLGDATDILSNFEPDTFDACITDPPWIEFAADTSLQSDDRTAMVFKEVYRVLKKNSFLYMFAGMEDFVFYRKELPKLGFTVSKTPLIWHKLGSITRRMVRSWEYMRDFELIILAVKGSPVLTVGKDLSAVFSYPVVPPVKLIHPNEKPKKLVEEIIEHCTYENNVILDPFAGSGVHLLAAKELKRHYIGIERNAEFYNNIVKRLEENNV